MVQYLLARFTTITAPHQVAYYVPFISPFETKGRTKYQTKRPKKPLNPTSPLANFSFCTGFCFDVLCRDNPFIDNPNSSEYNVPARVRSESNHFWNENRWISLNIPNNWTVILSFRWTHCTLIYKRLPTAHLQITSCLRCKFILFYIIDCCTV